MLINWPDFPASLEYLDGLSDTQSAGLFISPRSLYVLQNAVLGVLRHRSLYSAARYGEQYQPVDENSEYYDLYVSALADLERDIIEVGMTDFEFGLHQGVDISTTDIIARYMILGDMILANLQAIATSAGQAGYPIVIDSLPALLYPKHTTIVGNGIFRVSGVAFYSVTGRTTSDCGDKIGLVANLGSNWLGISPAITMAPGDAIWLTLAYERCQ